MNHSATKRSSLRSKVRWLLALLPLLLLGSGGCRICADCEDLAYPAYGGAWERTRREEGRVGSLFDPAGARASELVPREAPASPDEIVREQQAENESDDDPKGMEDRDEDSDDADEGEPEESEQDFRDKIEELRNRKLDDIEEEMEDQLREKGIDDIEVKSIPRKPAPLKIR